MAKRRAVVIATGNAEDGRLVRLLAPPPREVWRIETSRTLFRIVAMWQHTGELRSRLEFAIERRQVEAHGAARWVEVEQLGAEATVVGALCNRLWELEGLDSERPWLVEVAGADPSPAGAPGEPARKTCSGDCNDIDGLDDGCPLHGEEALT